MITSTSGTASKELPMDQIYSTQPLLLEIFAFSKTWPLHNYVINMPAQYQESSLFLGCLLTKFGHHHLSGCWGIKFQLLYHLFKKRQTCHFHLPHLQLFIIRKPNHKTKYCKRRVLRGIRRSSNHLNYYWNVTHLLLGSASITVLFQ